MFEASNVTVLDAERFRALAQLPDYRVVVKSMPKSAFALHLRHVLNGDIVWYGQAPKIQEVYLFDDLGECIKIAVRMSNGNQVYFDFGV